MKKKKRELKFSAKVNKRKLVISLTVLVILGIFIYNIPEIYDFFMYSDFQLVEGLSGGDYNLQCYGDDMLCYNNNEMSLINAKGETKWSVTVSTTAPQVYVKDDYILLADLGGNEAYLYDGDVLKTQIKLKEDIFAAALDNRGNIAVASKKQGYKGHIAVFSKNGEKQYEFSSGNGYISSLDIRRGEMVASQITAEDDALYSRIILLNWKDNEEKLCETKKDHMVFEVKYQDNGDIIAVSDKAFTGYDNDGDIDFTISYNGRKLKKYNISSDDNMVFCFKGDRNDNIIESYSKSGKLRGSRNESGEISNIDVLGEAIIINNMRTVKRIYPDGDEGKAIISKHDVRGIKLFPSRRYALVTGNSQATVIKVRK